MADILSPSELKQHEIDAKSTAERHAIRALRKYTAAPFDARFPNQNQTRHCWQNFVDYNRCIQKKGDDFVPCQYFKMVYTDLCPGDWVSNWQDQVETGRFPLKFQ